MLWFQKRGELFVSPRSYTVHKGGEGASNKPTRICNVKQWWICPHGASFAQLQVHIRSPFQVLMADCQRVPFENSLRRKLWEHAHGRNIFLTWLMMLMGTSFQNAPLNLPAMLRCSKPPRIRSKVPIVSTSPSLLQSASVLFLSLCTCPLGRDGKSSNENFH